MKKKVIIDNICFYLQTAGGISIVWQELINRLNSDSDINAEYIEFDKKPNNIFYKLLSFSSKKIHKSKLLSLNIQRYLNLKKISKTPYIFHSSYYRYSKDKTAINVTTVHDFTYEYFRNDILGKIHKWQKKKAILNSDFIVCISENTKQDLIKFIPEARNKRISVIYNGVSDDYKTLEKNTSLAENLLKYNLEENKYILFVGARNGYKNFKIAVQAIAKTNYKLAIIGGALQEEEIKFLNKMLSPEKYVLIKNAPNEELNILYNYAFALLYPSSYEGFGIPIIEAQKASCPVIAYEASSIPEVTDNKECLFNNLSESAICEKIKFLESPIKRAEVISLGKTNSARFSWDNTYVGLKQIYLELLRSCK